MNHASKYGYLGYRYSTENQIDNISKKTGRFFKAMAITALSAAAISAGLESNESKAEVISIVPASIAAGYLQRKRAINKITKLIKEYAINKQYQTENLHGIEGNGKVINSPLPPSALEQSTLPKLLIQQTALTVAGSSIGAEITGKVPQQTLMQERPLTGLMIAIGGIVVAHDSHNTRMNTAREYMDNVDRTVDYHVMVQGAGFEPAKA